MSDQGEQLKNALEGVRYQDSKRKEAYAMAEQEYLSFVAAIKVASALGVTNTDIARAADISPQRVTQILKERQHDNNR